MTQQWSLPAWAVVATAAAVLVLALLVAVLGLLHARARRSQSERIAQAESTAESLREQVGEIERRLAAVGPTVAAGAAAAEYVITGLDTAVDGDVREGRDEQGALAPVRTVPAPLFADLVLRESVVQAAGLTAGLRRALAPETRHRIRFAMRQEVKRARKQRRTDLRHARRAWEAHQREAAGHSDGHSEGSAA